MGVARLVQNILELKETGGAVDGTAAIQRQKDSFQTGPASAALATPDLKLLKSKVLLVR